MKFRECEREFSKKKRSVNTGVAREVEIDAVENAGILGEYISRNSGRGAFGWRAICLYSEK